MRAVLLAVLLIPTTASAEAQRGRYVGFFVEDEYAERVSDLQPYVGEEKRALEGADFYEAVGQPRLAREYRNTETLRTVFLVGGLVLTAGGIALTAVGVPGVADCGDSDDCVGSVLAVAGGVTLVGAGIPFTIAGLVINPDPVTPRRARELADEHNRKLEQPVSAAPRGLSLSLRF